MLKALLAPYLPYLYGAAAMAAVAAGVWAYTSIYDRGYQAASVVYELKAASQKAANDRAIEKANAVLNTQVSNLIIEKERLEDEVSRLNIEASQDPDGSSGGLKRGSVQRLNAFR